MRSSSRGRKSKCLYRPGLSKVTCPFLSNLVDFGECIYLIERILPKNMTEYIREKFYGGEAQVKEAFEELCMMVDNLMVNITLTQLDIANRARVHQSASEYF